MIGYPCFRFRIVGHYFALLTLALSAAIVLQVVTATRELTIRRFPRLYAERWHGGSSLYAVQFQGKETW